MYANVTITAPKLSLMTEDSVRREILKGGYSDHAECWPTGRIQKRFINTEEYVDVEVRTPNGGLYVIPVTQLHCRVEYPLK